MSLSNFIEPGKTIGIIGGGQLGRMLAFSAKKMGYIVGIFDPEEHCSAAQVADWQMKAAFDDEEALMAFAMKSDVVTYATEKIDAEWIDRLRQTVPVPQGSELLAITQDRILEKAHLELHNFNVAPYVSIISLEDLKESVSSIGYPCVLKALYGRANQKEKIVLQDEQDIQKCAGLLKTGTCVLESWIPIERELSVMTVRNENGETGIFPVSENIYRGHQLHMSITPARIDEEVKAEVERIGHVIAEQTEGAGVIGVEIFMTSSGTLYVNEIHSFPHESGYDTIEACSFSEFDVHIRAICGWPLPTLKESAKSVMVSVLSEHMEAVKTQIRIKPDWHFHFYGKKEAKKNEAVGHITILTGQRKKTIDAIYDTDIWK